LRAERRSVEAALVWRDRGTREPREKMAGDQRSRRRSPAHRYF
jgi:hypothetical protein